MIVDLTAWFSPDGAAGMSATAPRRVADTRSGLGGSGRLAAGTVLTVATGDVGASAVALNVTAVGADAAGFLTVYPCATVPPVASTVNYAAAEARPNNTIVAVAPGGLVCVYSSSAVDVIVDVTAAFSAGGQLEYLPAAPQRLADTRTSHVIAAGGEVAFAVPPPGATVGAVSVNVTATDQETDGFTTAFGCGTAVPEVSTLNQQVGEANANGAIVPVAFDSTGCVFTSTTTNLIVDLNGWWLPGGRGTPRRAAGASVLPPRLAVQEVDRARHGGGDESLQSRFGHEAGDGVERRRRVRTHRLLGRRNAGLHRVGVDDEGGGAVEQRLALERLAVGPQIVRTAARCRPACRRPCATRGGRSSWPGTRTTARAAPSRGPGRWALCQRTALA